MAVKYFDWDDATNAKLSECGIGFEDIVLDIERAKLLDITSRYERRMNVATTTNLAGDEKGTTAPLDRLAHHATVLTTMGWPWGARV